ncbi:MAG: hypothetical protein L0312_13115, partial [Acidobacteria bacterium]|nr:hypothetical protein [Acidobacteriota bacterium]
LALVHLAPEELLDRPFRPGYIAPKRTGEVAVFGASGLVRTSVDFPWIPRRGGARSGPAPDVRGGGVPGGSRTRLVPHALAWTDELFRDLGTMACQGMLKLSRGEVPDHVVNKQVLQKRSFQKKLDLFRG